MTSALLWQPGEPVHLRGSGQHEPLILGERMANGEHAVVFRIAGVPGQLAKLYTTAEAPPDLGLLGRHLRRALGDPITSNPGSPNLARPTFELYAKPEGPLRHKRRAADRPAGFVMREFAPAKGWMALDTAGGLAELSTTASWCLAVARRLARDLYYFHRAGLIAGDLSDTNVLVDRYGEVAWIDVDSFGALATDGLAAVATYGSTPECRAPEKTDAVGQACSKETDRFALALQVTRLLTCGFHHPFAIERRSADGSEDTVDDRVRKYDSWMVEPSAFNVVAVGHPGCPAWPEGLATLTQRAFTLGQVRPKADEWLTVLEAISETDLIVQPPARPVRVPQPSRRPVAPVRPPTDDGRRRGTTFSARRIVLLICLLILVLVVGAYLFTRGSTPDQSSTGSAHTLVSATP